MNKKSLSLLAAAAVLASSAFVSTPANAFFGSWWNPTHWFGNNGWDYPYYGYYPYYYPYGGYAPWWINHYYYQPWGYGTTPYYYYSSYMYQTPAPAQSANTK